MTETLALDAPAFDGVRPLEGFLHVEDARLTVAETGCVVRRLSDQPYLQVHHDFPAASGELLVHCGGVLVDRADLIAGWQHSAVELRGVDASADLHLSFNDLTGRSLERPVVIGSIALSDSWGRGRRRRLKCSLPFNFAAVFEDASVHPCCARQWMKGSQVAGDCKTEALADIWNGPQYQRMRGLFLEGRYGETCREDICPVLTGVATELEPEPEVIAAINEGLTLVPYGPSVMHHDIDKGCNLDCVMCRDEKILPDVRNVDRSLRDIQAVLDLGSLKQLSLSGAGEPFAMRKVVKLLESDAFSSRGVRLSFTTNLTYFNAALWRRIGHNRIENVSVSADGASAAVYDSIRLGGDWNEVVANMRFLASLRREGKIGVMIWNYTVMRQNICDVGAAIRLVDEIGFDAIRFIGQLGERERTGGNMFEDGDIASLDRLYGELERADAFNNPRVVTAELGVDDRLYARPSYRLNLAQHIFDRGGYRNDAEAWLSPMDWRKCEALIGGVAADLQRTRDGEQALTDENIRFLRRFLSAPIASEHRFRRLRRDPSRRVLENAVRTRLLRWRVGRIVGGPPPADGAVEPTVAAG